MTPVKKFTDWQLTYCQKLLNIKFNPLKVKLIEINFKLILITYLTSKPK